MKALRNISIWLMAGFLASGFASQAAGHEAKVVKVTGSATVLMPGAASSETVAPGMMVPQGATIITGANSQVFLQVFSGGIATITEKTTVSVEKLAVEKEGDTVTSQEALLDLKRGTVLSALDPTKKAINHYGVRTPKGVAAARGTVYTVTVGEDNYTIEVTASGDVTITPTGLDESGNARPAVTISQGNGIALGGNSVTSTADKATVNQMLAVAGAALSVVAHDPAFAGEAATAQAQLTAISNSNLLSSEQKTAFDQGTTQTQNNTAPTSTPSNPPVTPVDVNSVSPSGG